jgi:EAL domain-containing protein (putative c-di-GMP-specific phosphodiesterase class I)
LVSQLRNLPVARVKIDRFFISDLHAGADPGGSGVVVRGIVDLAHLFGLVVVAEGVEDAVTASRVAELGVDQAQGFLYSRAVPAAEVAGVRVTLLPTQRRGAGPRAGRHGRTGSGHRMPTRELPIFRT